MPRFPLINPLATYNPQACPKVDIVMSLSTHQSTSTVQLDGVCQGSKNALLSQSHTAKTSAARPSKQLTRTTGGFLH
ncbi:hypothetical protein PCANC_24640 [Puccinia coronata f. sp. avenae]|uniref:Uncharacterized protein n=1 Tax=Puccinia coronata f. sp. avenae TaxID=200324 RepID=A0A2N5U4L1_9BASI|nr:hypothetical protein PCANC_24640 [Puccinia coronata f. sp. avenae]